MKNTIAYLKILVVLLFVISCGNKSNNDKNRKESDSIKDTIIDKRTELINKGIAYQDSIQKFLSTYKLQLDSLFINNRNDSSFKAVEERGEILIGKLFKSGIKYAVLAYQTTDSTLKTIVLKEAPNAWDTVLQYQSVSFFDDPMGTEIIDLTDFDGDNQVDLRITHNYWHIHTGEQSLLWLFKNGKFQYVKGFDEIVNPQYDKKTNRIYSYQSDGCADMDMQFFVYQLKGLEIKEIDDIFCECCDCANGSCSITRKGKTKSIKIDRLEQSFPDYFKEMIKRKTGLCKE